MTEKLKLMRAYFNAVMHAENETELTALLERYRDMLGADADAALSDLLQDGQSFGKEMLHLRTNGIAAEMNKKRAALSEEEQKELAEVERIIDENSLSYHFQPIVNTTDGEIYSYEALMRPISDMRLSPLHVLKYAGLTGRLGEIELATFRNVLTIIDNDKGKFRDRRVFINSIPKTMLRGSAFKRVGELLMKHSDTAVVELTEYAESDENELSALKERYLNMGIKIAIDDYGTGYSNVSNLLRYSPDYVKIDRSLITDIQNSPKKRHFVREIIEFCHGTGIMALAEGVETAEELRTVILLGADLIQGYYTAKPTAEVIDSIPYEIRHEIRMCQQERQDGRDQQVYAAETRERILLDKLVKDGYQRILVGKTDAEDNKVTIIGQPSLETDIHIEVVKNFKGKIVLENAHLSNVKNRPSINLNENSDVTLVLRGENKLDKSGIRVPETAKLTVEGDGVLDVSVDAAEYFGIGNDISSAHGTLIFKQSGMVCVSARGRRGVCIGSGLGGSINIWHGKCVLHVNGYTGVGIGALYGDSKIDIANCAVDADISLRTGVAVGSVTGSTEIRVQQSSVGLTMGGEEFAALGTIGGDSAQVLISGAIAIVTLKALRCTCIGSLEEATVCKIESATFRATADGAKALPFGGTGGNTKVQLLNADTSIQMETAADLSAYLSAEHVMIQGGRISCTNHGEELGLTAAE